MAVTFLTNDDKIELQEQVTKNTALASKIATSKNLLSYAELVMGYSYSVNSQGIVSGPISSPSTTSKSGADHFILPLAGDKYYKVTAQVINIVDIDKRTPIVWDNNRVFKTTEDCVVAVSVTHNANATTPALLSKLYEVEGADNEDGTITIISEPNNVEKWNQVSVGADLIIPGVNNQSVEFTAQNHENRLINSEANDASFSAILNTQGSKVNSLSRIVDARNYLNLYDSFRDGTTCTTAGYSVNASHNVFECVLPVGSYSSVGISSVFKITVGKDKNTYTEIALTDGKYKIEGYSTSVAIVVADSALTTAKFYSDVYGVDDVESYPYNIISRFAEQDARFDFDYTKHSVKTDYYGANIALPVLYLEEKVKGDTATMTKDNEVVMTYTYKDKNASIDPATWKYGECEVKWQGSSSVRYPKKNYTVKFDSKFEVVTGWGTEKKYCMKANFIDHSHARNLVSAKLWGQVVKSREATDDTTTALKALVNGGAVDGFPVMIVINGEYQGLYTFNIPKDGWMMGMDDENKSECILCADLHTDPNYFKTKTKSLIEDTTLYCCNAGTTAKPVYHRVNNQNGNYIKADPVEIIEPETIDKLTAVEGVLTATGEQVYSYAFVPDFALEYNSKEGDDNTEDNTSWILSSLNDLIQKAADASAYWFDASNTANAISGEIVNPSIGVYATGVVDNNGTTVSRIIKILKDSDGNMHYVSTNGGQHYKIGFKANASELDNLVDWNSAIDYYIFTVLLGGYDMTGKNYLLSKFDGGKWFFSAYDLDTTFGINAYGTEMRPASTGTLFSDYARSHSLMQIIREQKFNKLKARYEVLRGGVLSEDNVATVFANFIGSIPKVIYDSDVDIWRVPSTSSNDLHQITDWYRRRVAAIDKEMAELEDVSSMFA